MATSLLFIIIILVFLIIFWPGLIGFFYTALFSGDRLQLNVTSIQDSEMKKGKKTKQKNLHIRIKNRGRNEIEIKAPVLEFVRGKKARKFQPKLNEDAVYPLILNPKTYHEFNIDLDKILQAKPELLKYKTARIIFTDRENKNTVVKSIRI